jgi:hypothetical protein
MSEPFVVKHYSEDARLSIKGNGFDGLSVGDDREEAEDFIRFVNSLISRIAELEALLSQTNEGYAECIASREDLREELAQTKRKAR